MAYSEDRIVEIDVSWLILHLMNNCRILKVDRVVNYDYCWLGMAYRDHILMFGTKTSAMHGIFIRSKLHVINIWIG